MSLVRWNPMRELHWLDRFGDLFAPLEGRTEQAAFAPAIEVFEDDGGYTLRAEVPGISKKELSVGIDGDLLTISGERRAEERKEHGSCLIQERRFGAFERRLRLPETVDLGQVEASHEDGVLTIELPKKEEAKVVKRDISVN